jgi:phytanoyl-CoA hydroxylase
VAVIPGYRATDQAAGSFARMTETTFATRDPIDRPLSVPVAPGDDPSPRFEATETDAIARYYAKHGYVVIRDVVPIDRCRAANAAFDVEVKHDPRPFYRLSGTPEVHERTPEGYMRDGIRDVQDLDRHRYGRFRQASLDVVTDPTLHTVAAAVLGERAKIVQTMYFEGNPATQPHQDSYYLDASPIGTMTAAWIACEDIDAGAGRFYVCPGSHRLDLPRNAGDHNIAEHHDRYLTAVTDAMRDRPLEVRAPVMRTGDVLLWSALTVHGSLATATPDVSRRSFTAHLVADSAPFLQWQHRTLTLDLTEVNGVRVHHPKDQSRLRHKARFLAETRLPGVTATAKRVVSARLLRR